MKVHYGSDPLRNKLKAISLNGVIMSGIHSIERFENVYVFYGKKKREAARIVINSQAKLVKNKELGEYKTISRKTLQCPSA